MKQLPAARLLILSKLPVNKLHRNRTIIIVGDFIWIRIFKGYVLGGNAPPRWILDWSHSTGCPS